MSDKNRDVKDKKMSEPELIEALEGGGLTPVEFLEKLEAKSELKKQWKILNRFLKKNKVLRNTELEPASKELGSNAKKIAARKNFSRGVLSKFAEWGVLASFKVNNHQAYFCALPDFYKPEELYELLSESEKARIAAHLTEEPMASSRLASLLYGDERNTALLETYLASFVGLGLVKVVKKTGEYSLTPRGSEKGIDAQSIKTIKAEALENELFVKSQESKKMPQSRKEVIEALRRDRKNKTIPLTDLSAELGDQDIKLLFIGEVLYGNQFTDEELLDWVLNHVEKPTLALTSGLVQGRFEIKNKKKTRGLCEEGGLNKPDTQFHVAGMLLDDLEKMVTSRVCVIQSDDDYRLAEDYGTEAHLKEGKNPWKFGVDWSSFSAEMKRRLENKELDRKIRIQSEIIQSYMYRIGRSLMNVAEVKAKIGVSKSEYRLIMEIMIAKRRGFDYPKDYEKVVNVDALYGDIGKRIVTPNPLRVQLGNNREIRLVHNAGFSDITQYFDVHQHLSAIAKHLGFSRRETPYVLADYHQEKFYAQYLQGTWVMNLPGMQDTMDAAAFKMTEWSTRILESKERRQSRVRKEPVSPSVPEVVFCRDGRIRFRILNEAVMRVLEDQKNKPEQREVIVVGQDFQFGSITNWPELTAKFVDYGLYGRRANKMWLNGDVIHGYIYPQHGSESRPMRLTGLHSQKIFGFNLLLPLILSAPNLKELAAWLGNHEWNNFDTKRAGDMPLTFLETGLMGVLAERRRAGTNDLPLERAMTVSRIRWNDTHNPQGDIVNWPFFADNICGFKVAVQHMWQPFASKTPVDDGQKWLRAMAKAARNIDLMVGGHYHSIWMTELGDKLIVQGGASASQSGYELARGLMSTVMFTLLEISNRDGIIVEFVPWEFLLNHYKFQCPAYKGKDEEFMRPKKGTLEYEQGKMSPYIEKMIDYQTRYLGV